MSTRPSFDWLARLVDPEGATGHYAQPRGVPPTQVGGGFGTVPGAKAQVNTSVPVPAPARISREQAQNLVMAELLGATRGLLSSTTELTAQIRRGGAKNGVIGTELVLFGASGVLEVTRPVTIGSICIHNVGSTPVTVQVGAGSAATAPNSGQGMQLIPANTFIPVPIGQKGFTLYGTAGQFCNLQLFTGLQGYGVSV